MMNVNNEKSALEEGDSLVVVDKDGFLFPKKISIANFISTFISPNLVQNALALPIGNQNMDGSWRIVASGDDISIQRKESGDWVEKQSLTSNVAPGATYDQDLGVFIIPH